MTYELANIAKNLNKYKQQQGLTVQELAQAGNISHDTIIKLLNGKIANPSIKTMCGISCALNVPLQRFLE